MPSFEVMDRYEKAIVWDFSGTDQYGQPKTSVPREITVRWVWGDRLANSPNGSPITTNATVIVNEEISVGSTMWLGELEQWYGSGGTGSGEEDDWVMEVVSYNEAPDLKNRNRRRELGLAFYKDQSPEVV